MNKWHELEDDASRATIVVQKLTSRKEELRASLPRGTEPMPRSELHFCNGLAFLFARKLGAGISFEAGHGFVIRKIYTGEKEGRPTWAWSAPLFLTMAAAGLGLTLGYTEIESVIVLDTPEAVQSFTRSQWAVDTDITGAAGGAVGAHLPATAANMSNMGLSDKTFTYSITKGAILDVSLTGLNYSLDVAMNQAFYGGQATPQSILDGGVEAPEPMQELYGALDKVLKEYYESVEGQAELATKAQAARRGEQRAGPAGEASQRAEAGEASGSGGARRGDAVPVEAAAAAAEEGDEITPLAVEGPGRPSDSLPPAANPFAERAD